MNKKPESTKANQSRTPKKPTTTNRTKAQPKETRLAAEELPSKDIISLILQDHQPIKSFVERLKNTDTKRSAKEQTFEDFVFCLTNHAKAEEKTLYVQMKDFDDLRIASFEGDTEHAIADQLVQEIHASPDDDEWNAKVKVLAEMVEHHIKEEEEQLLPDVEKKIEAQTREALGQEYIRLKDELDILKNSGAKRTNYAEHRLN